VTGIPSSPCLIRVRALILAPSVLARTASPSSIESTGTYWDRLRVELEKWFRDYPGTAQSQLQRRFRQSLPSQHSGAWWELYLHRLFSRLDLAVSVDPTLPDTRSRPDFRITAGDKAAYIEASTSFSGLKDNGGLRALLLRASPYQPRARIACEPSTTFASALRTHSRDRWRTHRDFQQSDGCKCAYRQSARSTRDATLGL
jgi:hypothetical protein